MTPDIQDIEWRLLKGFNDGSLTKEEEKSLMKKIAVAYGPGGLGLLTVTGIDEYSKARLRLLPLAQKFALLPDVVKDKYKDPESTFQFGWSHGVEILQNGTPDVFKGSYYANPKLDVPSTNPKDIRRYPTYARPNIWPESELPELREAFMGLGQLVVRVGEMLAKACDHYVREKGYPNPGLEHSTKTSPCPKARLLHYFPTPDLKQSEENWCGVHCDHGTLTGLCRALYLNDDGEEVQSIDGNVGLHILDSEGKEVKVSIPTNSLAFQLGQAAQILSSGVLRATPHYVKASSGTSYCRNTFAVFLQPHWDTPMNSSVDPYTFGISEEQWRPNMNFGEFTEATINYFYKTSDQQAKL
mmetsp:Transcript_15325/g.17348  ORF Transcript_15325/g.17348 Transcript_15325/m.17348 type:complete len:356 (-) Transcript_15325:113-1180(-)|eukprot:CAMPEP_0184055454 /NCGR_PEP_ID=MMETSP0956-20121227/7181_1 /TAXON_ID=627963 /ORGANISM="Aplanochytrium sp, Strain PBS07" /LENGTH=355 /DNA_ID=CAMNT_0026349271 /DNA_START=189 /DNA_END=1256 /DNA_ORIENTATION=-